MTGIQERFSLKGKVSLVTGGGRGIGFGIAGALAEAGSNVVIAGRTAEQLEASAKEIKESCGVRCLPLRADLQDLNEVERVVQTTMDEFGRIDVLVNNAGTNVRKPFLEITPDEFDHVLALNIRALFFLTQRVAKIMIDQGDGGRVINIASLSSVLGIHNISPYGSSKGAVNALTKSLAIELAPHKINVNAIAPGYLQTTMTEAVFQDEKRRDWILSRIPLGYAGTPADLQGAAVFLATPASDYLTGITLFVDGGWTAGA